MGQAVPLRHLWLSLLLLFVSGCRGCFNEPPLESAVDVPTDLKDLEALHDPPDVLVEVERRERKQSSGPRCGHSMACIIVLPFALAAPLFPDKWDHVTVTENGVVTYEGRFSTRGEFLEATVRADERVRAIGVLALQALGRRFVIELATAPLEDGEIGAWTRSEILSQVDLIQAYEAKLASVGDVSKRVELLVEMATWLQSEAMPWLLEALQEEPTESTQGFVEQVCRTRVSKDWDACGAILDGLKSPPDVLLPLLFRESQERADRARTERLGRALVDLECREDTHGVLWQLAGVRRAAAVDDSEDVEHEQVWETLKDQAQACKTERQTHLGVALGLEVEDEAIATALAGPDEAADQLAAILGNSPERHALLVEALDQRVRDGHPVDALMKALSSLPPRPPTEEELSLLGAAYVQGSGTESARNITRACILDRLWTAKKHGLATDRVLRPIREAYEQSSEGQRSSLAVALVMLGEADRAREASKAFEGKINVPPACRLATSEYALVGFGLFRAGCTHEEAMALQQRAGATSKAPATAEPDSLCVDVD